MYNSQHEQDKFLNENFFKNKKNGIFLDIGAHDGKSLSNTLFFEKELDWSGICVEPMPEVYEKLKNTRNCKCLNVAATNTNKEDIFLRIKGYSEMLSGLLSEYNESHLKRIDFELQKFGGSKEEIKVKCVNVTDMLLENEMTYIDYCSIDTEGNELKILEAIDFDKINISFFSIENNTGKSHIKKFLKTKGYKIIKLLGCDEIYQKI